MKTITQKITLFLFFLLMLGRESWGQFNISAPATNYTQDFNTLANGSWTNNTTMSGWYAKTDATASITTYGANTGATTTAGLYAFGVAGANLLTDRALGYGPSNGFTGGTGTGKGYMGWRLKNITGAAITSITITWTGEQWRKDNTAAQSLVLEYQTGVTVTDPASGAWTNVSNWVSPNLGTGGALDGNLAGNRTPGISNTISVSIPNGEEIMLRWADLNDSGNDHFLTLDDVTVSVVTSAAAPAINLQGLGNTIPTGNNTFSTTNNTEYGNVPLTTSLAHTFSIQNLNTASATLTVGVISFVGGNASDFSVTTAPTSPVAINTNTTFVVTFTPSALGIRTTTMSIVNSDATKTPYTFDIRGNGIPNQPEIDIKGNSVGIVSGTITTTVADFTDFGAIVNGNTFDRIFTIFNTGSQPLTITTPISISGTGFALFGAQPATSIVAGGSTSFTIRFTATSVAVFNGTVNIANNDADENPYAYAIKATVIATAPLLQLQYNTTSTNRACGATYAIGALQTGQVVDQIIRIRNTGTGVLNITSTVLSGANVAEFDIITLPAGSVVVGSFTDVRLRHTPISTGAKTATLTINGTCVVNLTSTISATAGTYLYPGDLALLGFNYDTDGTGAGGNDEIIFVCFKDITSGTRIDITENAYMKCPTGTLTGPNNPAIGNFGTSEGWISLTYTGATPFPAGRTITFAVNSTTGVPTVVAPAAFAASWCGAKASSGGGAAALFNLNGQGEQIFFLQGGTGGQPGTTGCGGPFFLGNNTATASAGTYTGGRFLYGFNTKTNIWSSVCANSVGGGTQNSAKPENFDCFLVSPTAQADYNSYTGPLTNTTKRNWINRITNSANWTGYTGGDDAANTSYYAATNPTFTDNLGLNAGRLLVIDVGGYSAGVWVGDNSTDWFDCGNWQNRIVPDATVSVEIGADATQDAIIDVTSPFAGLAPTPNFADCNDINIKAATANKLRFPALGTNTLRIYGDWNNEKTTASFVEGNGTVDFRSNITQTISTADASGETFYNITLNKAGGDIMLGGDVITTNNFTFSTNTKVLLGNFNKRANGTITGANASRYFQTLDNLSSGGFLIQNVSNGSTKLYAVGNSDYTPATISNSGTTNDMQIRVFSGVFTGGTSGGTIATLENTVKKTWEITPLGAGFNANITLQWNTAGSTFNPADCWIEKNPGAASWIASPTGVAVGSTRNLSGVTSFSKFTVNSVVIILPIELVSFTAKINQNNHAQLDWVTVSEINAAGFDIEKSFDGKSFEKIGYQNSLGGADIIKNYQFFDKNFKNAAYYRLKLIDNDKSFKYSKIIYLNNQKTSNYELTIIPNPTQGDVKLILGNALPTENITLKVFSITGKEVMSLSGDILTVEKQLSNQLLQVPAGMYVVRMQIGEQILQTKLIKN